MIKTYKALRDMGRAEGKSWFRIEAKSETETEIYIYDEIGYYGISADFFVRELAKVTAKTIKLRLNTPGGSVFDGVAIYNALKMHSATVETYIDGLAASMGSIIALAGDKVKMASNAMFMIHNPWSLVVGDAATMRKEADLLEKIADSSLVKTYADKSGVAVDEIKGLMDAETWFDAEEALEFGFIDEIVGEMKAESKFDLSCFCKVPAKLQDEEQEEVTPRFTNDVRRKRLALMELI